MDDKKEKKEWNERIKDANETKYKIKGKGRGGGMKEGRKGNMNRRTRRKEGMTWKKW